jgi:ribosomal-protein-alanine N-acetyltransferase
VSGFRIWRGSPLDAPILAALHAPAFSDAWPQAAFASLLQRDGVIVLLGARNVQADAEGFILLQTAADEAEVLTFCVTDSARRCGLGRALLQAACEVAAAKGAQQMFLEAGEGNVAAMALYQRAGFVEVGRRRAYYHQGPNGSDAIVMRRPLNQR